MIEDSVHIGENSISIGQYQSYVFGFYMKKWWWAYVLPLLTCVSLSILNINFIFAAIILLFLVYTMILYIVVSFYGLCVECSYSIMPKEIEMNNDGLFLTLRKKVNNNDDEDAEPKYEFSSVKIEWQRIERIEAKDKCMLLMFEHPTHSFLAIPYEAFDNEDHLRKTLSIIRSYIS